MEHSSLTQAMAMSTTVQARQPVIVKVKNSYKEKNNTHKYWIYENVRTAGLFKCKEVNQKSLGFDLFLS